MGNPDRVSVPTGVARYPKEVLRFPRAWVERRYNVTYWADMPRGGHFAAMEQPDLFVDDLRTFFRTIRSDSGDSAPGQPPLGSLDGNCAHSATSVGRTEALEVDRDDRAFERVHVDLAQRRQQTVVRKAGEEAVDASARS